MKGKARIGHQRRHRSRSTEVQPLEAASARGHGGFGELIRSYVTKEQCYILRNWHQSMVSMSSAGGFADMIEQIAIIVERSMRDTQMVFNAAPSPRRSRVLA